MGDYPTNYSPVRGVECRKWSCSDTKYRDGRPWGVSGGVKFLRGSKSEFDPRFIRRA